MSQQLPLFTPESSWRPEAVFPDMSGEKTISIDVETRDPDLLELGPGVRRGGRIVGVSVSTREWSRYYPIRHEGGDNLDEAQVLGWLRDQTRKFSGDVVGANLSYDLDYLAEERVTFGDSAKFRDCLLADALLYEHHRSYSLDAVAMRVLGVGKNESALSEAAAAYGFDKKRDLWRLPARFVGPYAEADSRLPMRALDNQVREIESQGLGEVWELESCLIPVILEMTRRGVPTSDEILDSIEQLCAKSEASSWDELCRLTGVRLSPADCWSSDAIARALVAGGITPQVTAKTKKPSITTEWLASVDSPIADAIRSARRYNKVRTTFVESIRRHSVKGRIHCSYHQLRDTPSDGRVFGTISGRMSCTNPNLQQQPIRDKELGKLWRSIFVADEGSRWLKADYSQQEPRRLICYAELMGLRGGSEAAERLRKDPNLDIYQGFADMASISRRDMKTIYLGLTYGMGEAKLSRSLGAETVWEDGRERAGPAARKLMEAVHSGAPFIREFSRAASRAAERRGWVKTVSGRRCRLVPVGEGSGYEDSRKAGNKIIQGSCADQTKRAMVDLRRAGHHMYLQVHDELNFSVSGDAAETREISEIMAAAYASTVPFKVDVSLGDSWGGCA